MSTLIWQSAVLLFGAYFVGVFFGCVVKRILFAGAARPAHRDQPAAGATATGPVAQATAAATTAAAAAATVTRYRDKPAETPIPAETPPPVLPRAAGSSAVATATAPIAHTPPRAVTAASASPPPQDLTLIRNIDTALRQRLHAEGVVGFADMAAWTPADVARLSKALGLSGRIAQENWIEQAQILANGGQTYYSRRKARGELATAQPTAGAGQPIAMPAARPPTDPAQAPVTGRAAAVAAAAATGAMPARIGPASQDIAVGTAGDRLQLIGGINAEVERLLNEHGVMRFAHIANWTADDTSRFDQLLGSPGRIARENWIEQARVLASGGDTAYSRAMARRLVDSYGAAASGSAQPAAATGTATPAPKSGGGNLAGLRSVRSEAYLAPAAQVAAEAAGSDDLKRIRGVGVLIERKLNAFGVTRYEQIANWTVADIERFSERLDFKGRIERENWVEQARILSAGGQTEFSRRIDRGEVDGGGGRS